MMQFISLHISHADLFDNLQPVLLWVIHIAVSAIDHDQCYGTANEASQNRLESARSPRPRARIGKNRPASCDISPVNG